MRNIILITKAQPTQDDVKAIVERLGGYWNVSPTHTGGVIEDGVIERGESAIYVSHDLDIRSELDPSEIEVLRHELGSEPGVSIDIHIGHRDGSLKLAWEVMDYLVEQFGGHVDATSLRSMNKEEERETSSGVKYRPEW